MSTVLLEPDDLLRMPDGDFYELVDGVAKEKPTGAKSERVVLRLASMLDQHATRTGCGIAFGSNTGYRNCFPGKPRQLRKPDVSFIASGRLPNNEPPEGDLTIAPDFIAEGASPGDGYEEILERRSRTSAVREHGSFGSSARKRSPCGFAEPMAAAPRFTNRANSPART